MAVGELAQAFHASVEDRLGGTGGTGQRQDHGGIEEMAREQLSGPRHELMQGFLDLTAQYAGFAHQVAALSAELLQFQVDVRPAWLEQAETIDGSAEYSGQVGFVGFVVGVGRLAEL